MSRLLNAHLHRFHEYVAISLPGNGETKYLTAKEARNLAKQLNKVAKSVESEKFVDSSLGAIEVKLTNEGNRS